MTTVLPENHIPQHKMKLNMRSEVFQVEVLQVVMPCSSIMVGYQHSRGPCFLWHDTVSQPRKPWLEI